MRTRWLSRALLPFLIGVSAEAWDLSRLDGVESPYTSALIERLAQDRDPYLGSVPVDENGFSFVCFKDPKDDLLIGVAQFFQIKAPLSVVSERLLDFESYPKWFDGLVNAKSQSSGKGRFVVATEQSVPIPFVANIRNQLIYADETIVDRSLLRYQLKESNNLKSYDGFILLKRVADSVTDLIEYDFFRADWGVARIIGKESIWIDSLRAIYQTDLAIKMRSESSEISDRDVLRNSRKIANKLRFKECLDAKVQFLKPQKGE